MGLVLQSAVLFRAGHVQGGLVENNCGRGVIAVAGERGVDDWVDGALSDTAVVFGVEKTIDIHDVREVVECASAVLPGLVLEKRTCSVRTAAFLCSVGYNPFVWVDYIGDVVMRLRGDHFGA